MSDTLHIRGVLATRFCITDPADPTRSPHTGVSYTMRIISETLQIQGVLATRVYNPSPLHLKSSRALPIKRGCPKPIPTQLICCVGMDLGLSRLVPKYWGLGAPPLNLRLMHSMTPLSSAHAHIWAYLSIILMYANLFMPIYGHAMPIYGQGASIFPSRSVPKTTYTTTVA